MKKIILTILFIMTLLTTSSCSKSEEIINEEILEMVENLITYNWKLNNIKMTFEDYQKETSHYFEDKNEFNAHIKNSELSPMILENVRENDSQLVKKYESRKIKNYDLLDVKISKVYGEVSSLKKFVYIHMIVSPNTTNQTESGVAYTAGGYRLNEERNILIELIETKNNVWRISDFQGNSYLVELKEKLSKEFVKRYTTHDNKIVEYTTSFKLINEY